MTAQELKNSILQLAIQGKLVEQDSNDEPATVLLEKIKKERDILIKEKKIKKEKYSEIYKDETDNHYYEKFEDGTVNDITDEIPFEIPSNWSWTRIGNFEEINLGFTYKPDYTEDGIYFLSVKDISGGKIDFSKAKKVSQTTYNNASYGSKPHKGDILFGRVGTMGKPQIIETDIPFCIFVSLGFFRDHLNLMNKKYICLWMESFLFQQQVNINVKGAAQKNLNTGWLKDFLIPIPPLNEQQRIVDRFNIYEPYFIKYDSINTKLDNLNYNYKDELKKSVLQYAIQGKLVKQDINDESAEVLINKIIEEKRELIKTKQIKKENLSVIYKDDTDNQFYEKFDDGTIINITDEIIIDIPQNWRWTRLRNIVYNHGQKKPDTTFSYIDIGTLDNINYKLNENENIIEADQAPSRARKIVKKGDVLYSTVRPYLHNICIVDKEFSKEPIASTGFAVLTCLTGIYNKYLFYLLLTPFFDSYANSNENARGVAYPAINDEKLYKALIPIPPTSEQKNIVDKLEKLFNKIG